ncbi:MAG: response regulator, partial [Treponema sp.]|nr:response regulator [Treponema sp.]
IEEIRDYNEKKAEVRFTAPEARVLIVDDIKTNLDVAEGLLVSYAMRMDTCLSGDEAVKLVRKNKYDLVLMDHMMPGMDGIETTRAIRALPGEYFQRLPVVVLTANAIAGMRDMFLEMGFNDYISKPIEIVKLNEIIARWIPEEKQIKAKRGIKRETFSGETGIFIPGVDTHKGITMTGGTEAGYRKVLAQFYKDAAERLPLFAETPTEGNLPLFTAQAHAIKSASGTIGAVEVSAEAAKLEAAGKTGDKAAIREGLPAFREHLTGIIEGIGKALKESEKPGVKSEDRKETKDRQLHSSLLTLKEALKVKNMKEIDRILEEIEQLPLDAETWEWINTISDQVLLGEYEGAITVIEAIIEEETSK